MQEIADRAGVNKAMLFYYFSSKDQLYREVLDSIFRPLFEAVNSIVISEIEPHLKIEQIINTYTNFLSQNEGFPRIMAREMASGGVYVASILKNIFGGLKISLPMNVFTMIDDSVKKGQFRKVDPIQTFLSIIGMCLVYFLMKPILVNIDEFKIIDSNDFLVMRQQSIIDLLENGLLNKQ